MTLVTINTAAPLGARIVRTLIGVSDKDAIIAAIARHYAVARPVVVTFEADMLDMVDSQQVDVDDVVMNLRFECLFGIRGSWSSYVDEKRLEFDEPLRFDDEIEVMLDAGDLVPESMQDAFEAYDLAQTAAGAWTARKESHA